MACGCPNISYTTAAMYSHRQSAQTCVTMYCKGCPTGSVSVQRQGHTLCSTLFFSFAGSWADCVVCCQDQDVAGLTPSFAGLFAMSQACQRGVGVCLQRVPVGTCWYKQNRFPLSPRGKLIISDLACLLPGKQKQFCLASPWCHGCPVGC